MTHNIAAFVLALFFAVFLYQAFMGFVFVLKMLLREPVKKLVRAMLKGWLGRLLCRVGRHNFAWWYNTTYHAKWRCRRCPFTEMREHKFYGE